MVLTGIKNICVIKKWVFIAVLNQLDTYPPLRFLPRIMLKQRKRCVKTSTNFSLNKEITYNLNTKACFRCILRKHMSQFLIKL